MPEHRRPRSLLRSGTIHVWAFTLAVAALGVVLLRYGAHGAAVLHTDIAMPWWGLAAVFGLTELFVVHVEFRADAHSFSLSEIPLVVALFFLPADQAIGAQLVGAGVVLLASRQQSVLKTVFNMAQYLLAATVAVMLFHGLIDTADVDGPRGWVAAFVAAWVSSMVSVVMIFSAISLSQRRADFARLGIVATLSSIITCTNTAMALIAVPLIVHGAASTWLLLVPAATLLFAYRAYTGEREQRRGLNFLYDATRTLHQSPDLESATVDMLKLAREMFGADVADIWLVDPDGDGRALRTTVGPGEHIIALQRLDPTAAAPLVELVRDHPGPAVLRGADADALGPLLDDSPVRDAMVASLHGANGPTGVFVLANRLSDVSSFAPEHEALFAALADQVSVALQKGHLVQSLAQLREVERDLSHRAFHDALTGLANRSLFSMRVAEALTAEPACGGTVAALFIDLDDFKGVNDTLGHEAGDRLLIEVADRLQECIRPGDTAARLGGDEFAVLLVDVDGVEAASRVARRVLESLFRPMKLHGQTRPVMGSIGAAVSTPEVRTADDLLRNADTAMYAAKAAGKGCLQVYDGIVPVTATS